MNDNELKIGDRVVGYLKYDSSYGDYIMSKFRYNFDEDEHIVGHGTIIEVSNRKVIVNWDDDETNDLVGYLPDSCKPELLLLEADLPNKVSQLEKEYLEVQEPLKNKVALAAQAINEAAVLARSIGMSLSETEYSYDLYNAMSGAGWAMSSIGC